jgi:hypothetical protein
LYIWPESQEASAGDNFEERAVAFGPQSRKWLQKKSRLGFRGYPVGTVAFYGPDEARASKVAVGIVLAEGGEAAALERWFSDNSDVRNETRILDEVVTFLRRHGARSVAMVDRILGCPHEEGIDYPLGEVCPQCPYWAGRSRWVDETLDKLER